MHNNQSPSEWQRRLRFDDEEMWNVLPASVREECLSLWLPDAAQAFSKPANGRQNERED